MIDLGDAVTLTVAAADIGSPSVAPTVTITLPDASTATPTAAESGGSWSATYTTTQSGRHVARWAATGAAFTDVFNVSAGKGSLISLAATKSYLNLATTTAYDETLREFIAGVTEVVENITGPILSRSVDEWYDGGYPIIALMSNPVVSVQTVTETFGANVVRTLTNQPLDGSVGVDAYGYTIDLESGTLTRRVSGSAANFYVGRRNIHCVYTAGRTSVPYAVQQGVKELIRVNFEPQIGGSRPGYAGSNGLDGEDVAGSMMLGYFVPNRVMQQLLPSVHSWGIA